MENIKLKYNFVETPRKFIVANNKLTWCFKKLYFNIDFYFPAEPEFVKEHLNNVESRIHVIA